MWFQSKQNTGLAGDDNLADHGHYRILKREDGSPWLLGHGAMGITYKAEDIHLRTPVALKVINPLIIEQPQAREFFLAEARGAASLHHRNAAAVHHLGVNRAGEFFFAMEFVEGETVEAIIKRQGHLEVPLALDIAQQVACALAAAARRQLIHRDIKPANLMLSDEGDGTLVVKVIDFGLCKSLLPTATSEKPRAGSDAPSQFLGTPHYASPEQIRNDPLIDGRADFYSLGATLWTMLAGQPVFRGPLALIRQSHLEEPPPLEDLPASITPPVRDLLARLLRKEPAGRPDTALELIDEIEAAAYAHRGPEADPRRHWQTQGCVPLVGSVLAHNFHLEALVSERVVFDGGGAIFRAEDVAGHQRVAVRLLDRARPLESRRAAVERLGQAPHPNLIQDHALSSCRGQPFLVSEWVHGFPLADVLRARGGALTPPEVHHLLCQAARAVDHVSEHRLGGVSLHPEAAWMHFAEEAASHVFIPSARLTQPLEQWPPYLLKLPLQVDDGAAGDSTQDSAAQPTGQTVRGLGQFAGVLLGGGSSYATFDADAVVAEAAFTLPGVSRTINQVIRHALASNQGFRNGDEFVEAFARGLAGKVSFQS